jgi:sulfur-carrier protein
MSELTILYFAALAEQVQCSAEQVAPPHTVTTVADLRSWLGARGKQWAALQSGSVLCAVNQEIVSQQQIISAGDEVAFFPPVTGG